MADYILEPINSDPDQILKEFVEFMQLYFPDWKPSESHLDFIIARYFSLRISMAADMAARVLRQVYLYFGATVVGILPFEATPASGTATFELIDLTKNHTLPSGTIVGIADDNGDIQLFSTVYQVDTLAGDTHLQADIIAVESGAAGSSLTGTVQLIEQIDWLSSGVVDATTSGGADAEDIDTYMNRMTNNLGLMAPRPVLAPDFAMISQNVAGVWRASAIDNFLPGPPPVYNAANAVGVAAIDQSGEAISGVTKTNLDNYLQALRQQNFIVNVLDPTYNICDVTVDAYKNFAADVDDAQAQVESALFEYLNPGSWGVPGYPLQIRGWENKTALRYLELTTVCENCQHIDYVSNLIFNATAGGGQDKFDKTFTGNFPLPRPGNIIVNIH